MSTETDVNDCPVEIISFRNASKIPFLESAASPFPSTSHHPGTKPSGSAEKEPPHRWWPLAKRRETPRTSPDRPLAREGFRYSGADSFGRVREPRGKALSNRQPSLSSPWHQCP